MKIELQKMTLTNFKGIRSLDIDFHQCTDISGDNATGKTTIVDAFMWLLFGKDSQDRHDFNIKTLGPDNKPYHNLDHEVSAKIIIDGNPNTLRRSLRENWVKKRGEQNQVFSGHVTDFYWNDVPLKKSEFEGKINYFIDSNIFKLVTNTGYFNALNWQERRQILLHICGEVSNDQVFDRLVKITNKDQFLPLMNELNQGKTLDEYKRQIAGSKKKIRDTIASLPARIDEANRSLPEAEDYSLLEEQIEIKKLELEKLDDQLSDLNKRSEKEQEVYRSMLNERNELMSQASELEYEIREQVKSKLKEKKSLLNDLNAEKTEKANQLRKLKQKVVEQQKELSEARQKIKDYTAKADDLRAKWMEVNATEIKFDESEFSCPTCKRAYADDDIESKKEEMTKNFQDKKAKELEEITSKGKRLKQEIEHLNSVVNNITADEEDREDAIKQTTAEIQSLEEKIKDISNDLSRMELDIEPAVNILLNQNEEYQFKLSNIRELKEKIEAPKQGLDNSQIKEEKSVISKDLEDLNKRYASKEIREKTLSRIKELEAQEKDLSQKLSDLEAIEFSIEEFTVCKMNMLEESLNDRFDMVTFKLFKEQINGGRTETCETLIDGVPYSDANTASKINAGIDIINTLSSHYDVFAPVFVDNAESVNQLIDCKSQIIRLIVSRDKSLKINYKSADNTADKTAKSSAK